MQSTLNPPIKLRWFQYSLRTLLIVVMLCAIPCIWLAPILSWAAEPAVTKPDPGAVLSSEQNESTARSLLRQCLDLQAKTDQISTRGVIETQSGKNNGEFWLRRNGKLMDISGRLGPPDAKSSRKIRLVFNNDCEVDYSRPVKMSAAAQSGIVWHKDLDAQRIHMLASGAECGLPLDGYLHCGGKRAVELLLEAKDLRIVADELIDGIRCSTVAGSTEYGRIALSIPRGEGSVAIPRKTTIIKEPNDLMFPGQTVSHSNDLAKPGTAKKIGYSEILDQVAVEGTAKGWVCVSGRLTRTNRFSGAADKAAVVLIKRKQTELHPAFEGTNAFMTDLRDGAHVNYMDDPKSGVQYIWHGGKVEPAAVQPGLIQRAHDQNVLLTIAEIVKLGGKVTIDDKSPGKPVISVDLQRTKVTDAGLEHLEGLDQLQSLNLHNTKVTDAGLEQLKGLTNLQSLNLGQTSATDAGLAHLKGLTRLQSLNLEQTQVTDTGLAQLKGLTQLQSLNLTQTKVTEAGVKKLSFPHCRIEY